MSILSVLPKKEILLSEEFGVKMKDQNFNIIMFSMCFWFIDPSYPLMKLQNLANLLFYLLDVIYTLKKVIFTERNSCDLFHRFTKNNFKN